MEKEQLLQKVKQTVQRIDPQAEVILFGSRARGDARPDSDWDFLILTALEDGHKISRKFWDALLEVEVESGEVITSVIKSKFKIDKFMQSPLY